MLTTCSEPGCTTIVLGGRCIDHERPQLKTFVRGRPFTAGEARKIEPVRHGSVTVPADSGYTYELPRPSAGLERVSEADPHPWR